MKINKASRPDFLLPRFLKAISEQIAVPTAIVLLTSLYEGGLSHDRMLANISPLFKNGRKQNVGNNRPVSFTSQ